MKKRLIIFIVCLLSVVCGASLLAACATDALAAPMYLRIEEDADGRAILYWRASKGADSYTVDVVDVDGASMSTRRTEFSLDRFSLEPGTYTINVRACSDDGETSAWASVEYFKEDTSGIRYGDDGNGGCIVLSVGSEMETVEIPDEYNGKKVTAIGDRAFMQRSGLTEIVLGKNIVEIGDYAFYSCQALNSVNFPVGLRAIGESAFQSCGKLTEISIPDSVDTIGPNAFAFCREVKNLTIAEGVKTIGNGAFSYCDLLETVVFPHTLESLGASVLSNCGSLKNVTVNGNGISIGNQAFSDSGATINDDNPLTEDNELKITLGKGVVSIGNLAFLRCTALASIEIPSGVTSIGNSAFLNCINLNSVAISDTVSVISENAFVNTALWNTAQDYLIIDKWFIKLKNLEYGRGDFSGFDFVGIATCAFQKHALQSAYRLPDSLVYINEAAFYESEVSSVIIGNKVKIVGNSAFADCKNLRSVVIGDSVEEIGAFAFAGCKSFTAVNSSGGKNINIPASVKRIGVGIFQETAFEENATGAMTVDGWVVGCKDSVSGWVELSDGVVGIADGAFMDCEKISRIYIPNSVAIIGTSAFCGCTRLTDVTLPAGLDAIPFGMFERCTGLTAVTIPDGVKKIGNGAFWSCSSLKSISIPDSVTEIEHGAFAFCDYLENVDLGNSLEIMGDLAFAYCTSLKSIRLPNSLKDIPDYAFYRSSSLASVDFGNGVRSIGDRAFYQCTLLSDLDIPASVTSIGEYAFYKCKALQKLDIGVNVQSIADYAFCGCENLIKAVIPDSVETLGNYAFLDCFKLQSVTLGANLMTIGDHAFMNCDELTVYTEASNKYSNWSDLWNSQYRPVVFGCVLSPDKDYVVSVTVGENTVENGNAQYGVNNPQRIGWTFLGWATSPDGEVEITAADLTQVPFGTTLYAVWANYENLPEIIVRPEYKPGWDSNPSDWMKPSSYEWLVG